MKLGRDIDFGDAQGIGILKFLLLETHRDAHAQDLKRLLFDSSVLKPFFGLIPVVEAFQLQSRRKRKYLQLPVSTFQKCWLSTFQI